jgi:deferrochelatase/peroxidase EfeB
MAADKLQNNNFTYDPKSQDRCPFAAHTRKTNPRADLNTIPLPGLGPKATETRRIMRRGIQFGPEVSDDERSSGVSSPELERGLLFVCYQSNIANGFQFIQKSKFHELISY